MNEIFELPRDEIIKKFNLLQTRYNNLSQTNDALLRDNDRLNTERDIYTIEKVKRLEDEKQELIEKLCGFRTLENIGNVYLRKPIEGYKTFRELFFIACKELGYDKDSIKYVLDFSLKDKEDGSQSRSLEMKLCYGKYLKLSKKLASDYYKDFKESSPRYKGKIEDNEMIKGKTGLHNQYPETYTKLIENYVLENPLELWGKLPSPIVYINGVFSCESCEKDIKFSSIRRHLASKKHKKN